ncbi:MAG: bifunctional 4-hydroxy-2-oxoglutarate aldolase/2-dehydro-3-deoxy-phosphogluconate aldolase [Selenomonadaceae bacterium]
MSQKILDVIVQHKIVAIVRGVESRWMIDVAKALYTGGVQCLEITFNPADEVVSRDTLHSINLVSKEFAGKIFVGAGTVLTVQNVEDAVNAGAEFMISPNVSQAVIEKTKVLGKISMPGAYTPTEAQQAYEYGADIIKIFPADIVGPDYFKAIKAPLPHLKLAAVGGVTVDNIAEFIKAGADVFGISSSLVNIKLVKEKNWKAIEDAARSYTEAILNFK